MVKRLGEMTPPTARPSRCCSDVAAKLTMVVVSLLVTPVATRAQTRVPGPREGQAMGDAIVTSASFHYVGKSTALAAAAGPRLDSVAGYLRAHVEIELVTVKGYTGAPGTVEAKAERSRDCAESVVRALVSRAIAPARLRAEGLGARTGAREGSTLKPTEGCSADLQIDRRSIATRSGQPVASVRVGAPSTRDRRPERPLEPKRAAKSINCEMSGRVFPHGSTWTCADGCNICSCWRGYVDETMMGCDGPPNPAANKLYCSGHGQGRQHGTSWSCGPCTTCTCADGTVETTSTCLN
jgi:outer membrane protein OmpA-like peptidoglycan-associated protein